MVELSSYQSSYNSIESNKSAHEMMQTITSPTETRRLQHQAPESTITVNEAVELIGIGKFQQKVLFAAGTCFMADSMEIMLLSFLTTVLRAEWGWSDADANENDNYNGTGNEAANITASMFAGALLGTTVFGRLGDRIGRKPVLFCAAFMISFFGLATALCNTFTSLLIVRFMVGFGVGGLTVPFDILAEFLPTENRGTYLLLIEYYWTFGSMIVPIIAYLTIAIGHSWRLFVVVCAIPCVISLIAGIQVPESPRWLILKGRNDEALAILKNAAITNGVNPDDIFPPGCVLQSEEEESCDFSELFSPKWRKITINLWVVWAGFAFCYYGTIMIITNVFGSEEQNDDDNNNDGEVSFDYLAIFISSSAELVGTMVVIGLVDRIGRIITQAFAYLIGGLSLFLLCMLSINQAGRPLLVSLAFIVRVCEMAGTCVTWISTAEILSTEIRSTGHSAANAVARIGGFCSPYIVAGNMSLGKIGIIMLIIHLVTAFSVTKLPETKGLELGKATVCRTNSDYSTELVIA